MTCREYDQRLAEYLDGALGARESADWTAHTATCPPCLVYLRSYRATLRLCRGAGVAEREALPSEFVRAVLDAARDAARWVDAGPPGK
jgi:anti-sigma factor RsiW